MPPMPSPDPSRGRLRDPLKVGLAYLFSGLPLPLDLQAALAADGYVLTELEDAFEPINPGFSVFDDRDYDDECCCDACTSVLPHVPKYDRDEDDYAPHRDTASQPFRDFL